MRLRSEHRATILGSKKYGSRAARTPASSTGTLPNQSCKLCEERHCLKLWRNGNGEKQTGRGLFKTTNPAGVLLFTSFVAAIVVPSNTHWISRDSHASPMTAPRHFRRREMLRSLVGGSLLMPGILSELLAGRASAAPTDPLSPKPSHFPAKAKRVIFIFSNGGVSQMDTFDPKPELMKADGKMMGVGGGLSNQQRVLLKPGWEFRPRRQMRHDGQRFVPAPARVHGRHLRHPFAQGRRQRALQRHARHAHRLVLLSPARASARG